MNCATVFGMTHEENVLELTKGYGKSAERLFTDTELTNSIPEDEASQQIDERIGRLIRLLDR